jgi:hypothetical protein
MDGDIVQVDTVLQVKLVSEELSPTRTIEALATRIVKIPQ